MDKSSYYHTFETRSVEETERFLPRSLAHGRLLKVEDPSSYLFTMETLHLGHVSLMRNHYTTEVEIEAMLRWDDILFIPGAGVSSTLTMDGETHVASEEQAVILPPSVPTRIHRPADSTLRFLRASPAALMRRAEGLTGRPRSEAPRFPPTVSLTSGPGAVVDRVMKNLEQALAEDPEVFKDVDVRLCYDSMLMSALLSLPNSYSRDLTKSPDFLAAARMVQHVEAYLVDRLGQDIGIPELLKVCGCSRSALFKAFKSVRGYSPMSFLVEQRLQKAVAGLMRPQPSTTVTEVALSCGFRHLGRFSQIYSERFGERPSETLRKTRE